jgi:hypothetical protein
MIPFLNQGAAGIQELMQEADAFHQTISTEAGKSASEFNDNLTRMKSIIQGVVNAVVSLKCFRHWPNGQLGLSNSSKRMA